MIFKARRYGNTSRLDERGIVGEIEQAVERNPALEAWILVTTREVPEQIQDAMVRAGLRNGTGDAFCRKYAHTVLHEIPIAGQCHGYSPLDDAIYLSP